jgi:hypothetical protein
MIPETGGTAVFRMQILTSHEESENIKRNLAFSFARYTSSATSGCAHPARQLRLFRKQHRFPTTGEIVTRRGRGANKSNACIVLAADSSGNYPPLKMSRLTRTGFWLLPWFPALALLSAMLAFYFPSVYPCPVDVRWGSVSTSCRVIGFFQTASTVAFLAGILLLSIAGVRRLIATR